MKALQSLLFAALTVFISPVTIADTVNINEADALTLANNLKGVGEKKSQAIVEYRKENGKFEAIDAITNVKGIGEITLKKNEKDMSLKSGLTRTAKKQKASVHKVLPTIEDVSEEGSN